MNTPFQYISMLILPFGEKLPLEKNYSRDKSFFFSWKEREINSPLSWKRKWKNTQIFKKRTPKDIKGMEKERSGTVNPSTWEQQFRG